MITTQYNFGGFGYSILNITNVPYKTIMTSPNYGNNAIVTYSDDGEVCTGDARAFKIFNTTVQFTVLNYHVLEPNYFYFTINEAENIKYVFTLTEGT